MAIHPFCQRCVWVGVVTQGPEATLTEEALTTGNRERNHNSIPRGEVLHLIAHFHHFSHKLMTEDISFFHCGDISIIQVQVRATDRCGGDTNNRVTRVQDLRIRNLLNSYVYNAIPTNRLHENLLPLRFIELPAIICPS